MTAITERVAAGAAFMDVHDPQWWRADVENAINVEWLNLEAPNRCVLGQRCPFEAGALADGYMLFGAHLSGIVVSSTRDLDDWAVPLGFQAELDPDEDDDASLDACTDEYDALTAEWRRVIEERRAA